MAVQPFANNQGVLVGPFQGLPEATHTTSGLGALDSAADILAYIGYVHLTSGPGTSKTLSSSGGKIHYRTVAVTFANAGTTIRVGLQDVASTGLPDTTFDVHDDLVGATDTITANAINTAVMSSGTKTVAHGDLIAVVFHATSRAGADTVTIARSSSSGGQPYCTLNGSRTASPPIVTIEFDDGTMGWFGMSSYVYLTENSAAMNTASTPDEAALIFQVPVPCSAVGLVAKLANVANSDDFEMILYSDPLGTPVAQRTLAQDMDQAAGSVYYDRPFVTAYALLANTDYAIAMRPTTANTLSYQRLNFGSGNSALRKPTPLGTNWYLATRSDQTGAFGSADTTILPLFGVWLTDFEDGTGGVGGTETAYVFVG
jgi:hypothetical protein